MEFHRRTIAKTISWRVIALIITFIGIFFFDKRLGLAISSAIVINIAKTVLYYLHERYWTINHWQYIKKHETRLRTLVKTISWKIITFVVTTVIIYFYIYDWKISLISGFSINFIKAIIYYFHERLWNKSNYGRKK